MDYKHQIDGIEIHVLENGAVFWASDWTKLDDLVEKGMLKRIHHGSSTYGAVTYVYSEHEINPKSNIQDPKPESPKSEARNPKPKKNPRPPLWQNKTYIATQGIGGLIYFGYKNPPGEFKTKKTRRESGARLYKTYHAFLRKFNLKPDGKLSEERAAAYEHGGTKKLKAREKRTSTLLNPKKAAKKAPAKKVKNNPTSSPKKVTNEVAAARAYKYFTGKAPKKALNTRRPARRTVFIELCKGTSVAFTSDAYGGPMAEWTYKLGGKKVNWDLENNALIIFCPELDKILGNDYRKPHTSPPSFTKRDENAAIKIFRKFQGKNPKQLEYRTLENKTILVEFGKSENIRYRSDKYGGEWAPYKHSLKEGGSKMYVDIGNSAIVIMGGDLGITKHGIEG